MPGVWEIVKSNLSPSEERLHVATVIAGIVAHVTEPGTFTKVRIRDILNAARANNLTAAELADLNGIVDNLDAEVGTTAKLVYLQRVLAYFTLAEASAPGGGDAITEAEFRAGLGI